MKEDVKFPEFNKSKNIRTFFDEVNDWIDLTKKSDEIKESLFKRFDYPFFVEKRLLHSLESYQKMKESKIDPKTIEFFSPKMREILFFDDGERAAVRNRSRNGQTAAVSAEGQCGQTSNLQRYKYRHELLQ